MAQPDPAPRPEPTSPGAWSADGVKLEAVERDLIAKALETSGNNRSRAARLLGITRSQLYYRMQKHGLDVDAVRARA